MIAIRPWDKLQSVLVPLSEQEKKALAASIEKHGVLDPILVMPDGRIIDGANRWEISNGKASHTIVDLDQETALALGVTINIARRQMSPEQIRELQERLRKDKERQRKLALKLRDAGKSQEEAAAAVGVTQQTVDNWEKGIRDTKICNAYTPPDLRISVPKSKYEIIYQQVKAGVAQKQVAANYKITQPRVSQIVRRVEGYRRHQAEQRPVVPAIANLKLGDFFELSAELKNDSISLVLTDPPYGQEWLGNWPRLAEVACRVLSPGGFLVTYTGQTYLPQVLSSLLEKGPKGEHLNYFWTSAILLPQGNRQEFHTKVVNNWKPALILTKGAPDRGMLPWWVDVVKSQLEKDLDQWQQSIDIARYFIKTFSPKGTTVLDPFAGTGTFLAAALLEGRNAYGYELDPTHYEIASARLLKTREDETSISN